MIKIATESLQKTGITISDLSRPVGKLSGGQQQAIAIVRAVMFEPQVLLFDEPTAALAAREVEKVLSLIQEQKARQRILALVSHRLGDVLQVSDRVVVMKQGRIVANTKASETTLSEIVERIVG